MSQRTENFERFIDYTEGDEVSPPLFSKKWLMKKFLKFREEDVLENEEYLKREKKERELKGISLEDQGSGSSGGSGGSSDLGGLGDLGGTSAEPDLGGEETPDTNEPQNVDELLDQEKSGKQKKDDTESFA